MAPDSLSSGCPWLQNHEHHGHTPTRISIGSLSQTACRCPFGCQQSHEHLFMEFGPHVNLLTGTNGRCAWALRFGLPRSECCGVHVLF